VTVEVFAADEQDAHPVDTMRWARLARDVLQAEQVMDDAELSLLFVDEKAIGDLNRRFGGGDGPTDVLAFPIDEEAVEAGRFPDSGGSGPGWSPSPDLPMLLGDVVICPALAHRNALQQGKDTADEIALLVVHGILHLMGMDHQDEREAVLMQGREQELLERFHRSTARAGQ
jgi:probable rRNA maturation factor